MKVIIAGSRGIKDPRVLESAIKASGFEITEVVCGGAVGADELGFHWAKERGIPVKMFLPDWRSEGKKAGIIRNIKMGGYAEALIALWDGSSRGSKHMIDHAKSRNLKVFVWDESKAYEVVEAHI